VLAESGWLPTFPAPEPPHWVAFFWREGSVNLISDLVLNPEQLEWLAVWIERYEFKDDTEASYVYFGLAEGFTLTPPSGLKSMSGVTGVGTGLEFFEPPGASRSSKSAILREARYLNATRQLANAVSRSVESDFLSAEALRSFELSVEAQPDLPWRAWKEGRDMTSGASFIQVGQGSARQPDIYVTHASRAVSLAVMELITALHNYAPLLAHQVQLLRGGALELVVTSEEIARLAALSASCEPAPWHVVDSSGGSAVTFADTTLPVVIMRDGSDAELSLVQFVVEARNSIDSLITEIAQARGLGV